MQHHILRVVCLACLTLAASACTMGRPYQRPTAPVTSSYKEASLEAQGLSGWKIAEPNDTVPRGKWWEVFQDPALNVLAEQVNLANQNLAAAEARLRGARAAIRSARATLFPVVTGGVAMTGLQESANGDGNRRRADLQLPLEVSYEPDFWGQKRRTIEANVATAQATAADLETARLSLQAELAINYFAMHGLDAQKQLLDVTIAAFEKALELTTNRYNQGVASQLEVMQARTQLESARAQTLEIDVERVQFEHALAILIGRPPAELTLPPKPITTPPPLIPSGVPSALLERRPDIAAAERRVAAANAQIGVAQAAFFPTITLSAMLGLQSSDIGTLFSWPSTVWSLGSALAQVVFDAGRRQAVTEEVEAAYDVTVAAYRQTVLSAFQEVEDHLAALRILEAEAQQQALVAQTAETVLTLAINRYKGGVTTYLEVIAAQSVALTAKRTEVILATRRLTAAVLLIKALGGGWRLSPT